MGSVPVELGNLSSLVELNLSMNALSGLLHYLSLEINKLFIPSGMIWNDGMAIYQSISSSKNYSECHLEPFNDPLPNVLSGSYVDIGNHYTIPVTALTICAAENDSEKIEGEQEEG
uniref:Uncharacterized protein n=1 Tax=Salix viminalis TaxID=40686 RepID=A0A6N2MDN3_SALVM